MIYGLLESNTIFSSAALDAVICLPTNVLIVLQT